MSLLNHIDCKLVWSSLSTFVVLCFIHVVDVFPRIARIFDKLLGCFLICNCFMNSYCIAFPLLAGSLWIGDLSTSFSMSFISVWFTWKFSLDVHFLEMCQPSIFHAKKYSIRSLFFIVYIMILEVSPNRFILFSWDKFWIQIYGLIWSYLPR